MGKYVHSAVDMNAPSDNSNDIYVNKEDRSLLRDLAARVAELAARPEEEEKKNLWYAHNNLDATRPLIFCDPENGWSEIIPDDLIVATSGLAKMWEMILRKEIFWGESMGDDRVVVPCFNVPYVATQTDWGMHETRIGGKNRGAYRWEAPLKDYSDIYKLKYPKIIIDHQKTRQMETLAQEIFDGLLHVRIKCAWWWSLGLTLSLVNLRGLEQILYDMYDNPDGLHQLMAFLRDGTLSLLAQLEEKNILSLNNDETYVGSGGFGWTRQLPSPESQPGYVKTIDMWGFAESQETGSVSPVMFEEFVFPYQEKILKRFGLNCYGCCERLNERWGMICQIPRLRRVSISPWSDIADMAEKIRDNYIFSLKPNPTFLAVEKMDEDYVRKSLKEALKKTKGCRVEIIMKDNNTLGGNPSNAVRWCRIAREEAERTS